MRDLTIKVRNPAGERVVGEVRNETPEAVAVTASELRIFQPEWQAIGPKGRKTWLLKLRDWVLDNTEHIAEVVQSESGKTRAEALTEPIAVADFLNYWMRNAEKFPAERYLSQPGLVAVTSKLTTVYRPYPLFGVITPRDFPFTMPALEAVPALAAGAALLLKPSKVTPLSAVEFVHGWTQVGAPPVLALATGDSKTGVAVIDVVDYVQFTGAKVTGRQVAARCAERLTPFSLDLAGTGPAIVLADADLERVANRITWGSLVNRGQVWNVNSRESASESVERVYVEAPVYDEFVAKLTGKLRVLWRGPHHRSSRPGVGASAAIARRDIARRYVDGAVAAADEVVTRGKQTDTGAFFEPRVLVDVEQSMSCITGETLGPMLRVVKVADEAEAIRLAKDSHCGNSATMWTSGKQRGQRMRRQPVARKRSRHRAGRLTHKSSPARGEEHFDERC
jgi:acyl-CoA reductase-like NAD-dependent aldehyde dehydrogenase